MQGCLGLVAVHTVNTGVHQCTLLCTVVCTVSTPVCTSEHSAHSGAHSEHTSVHQCTLCTVVQLQLQRRPGPLLQSTQNALSTCRKMALSQKSIKGNEAGAKRNFETLAVLKKVLGRPWRLGSLLSRDCGLKVSANASEVATVEAAVTAVVVDSAPYAEGGGGGGRQVGVTELSSIVCSQKKRKNCLLSL